MNVASFFLAVALPAVQVAIADYPIAFQAGEKWGFKDAAGKTVVAPAFDQVGAFACGLAPVNVGAKREYRSNSKTGGKWGYIDRSGTVVVPIQFDDASEFSDGLGKVLDHGRVLYLDVHGEVAIDIGENADILAGNFREGVAPIRYYLSPEGRKRETRYIDKTGQTVFSVDGYGEEFHEEMAVLKVWIGETLQEQRQLSGYLNRSGVVVVTPRFGEALEFHESMAAVRDKTTKGGFAGMGDSWGYIDKSGSYVIQPQFNEAHPFQNGFARVHVGGVLKPMFHFRPNWEGGEWLLIASTGEVLKRSKQRPEYPGADDQKQASGTAQSGRREMNGTAAPSNPPRDSTVLRCCEEPVFTPTYGPCRILRTIK